MSSDKNTFYTFNEKNIKNKPNKQRNSSEVSPGTLNHRLDNSNRKINKSYSNSENEVNLSEEQLEETRKAVYLKQLNKNKKFDNYSVRNNSNQIPYGIKENYTNSKMSIEKKNNYHEEDSLEYSSKIIIYFFINFL